MAWNFTAIRTWSRPGDPLELLDGDVERLLGGGSPREVLHRLMQGDPLAIEARSAARLSQRALLLDRSRVALRSAAQVAFHASRFRNRQAVGLWLGSQIDRAIAALIERDRESERSRAELESDESWDFLSQALGVAPLRARSVALIFNDLPFAVRRVFWRAAVEGVAYERCVAEGLGQLEQISERLNRALLALSLGMDPGGADPQDLDVFHG